MFIGFLWGLEKGNAFIGFALGFWASVPIVILFDVAIRILYWYWN